MTIAGNRLDVQWCVDCGARFTEEEVDPVMPVLFFVLCCALIGAMLEFFV